PSAGGIQRRRFVMMGRQTGDQGQLFYLVNLERRIPAGHLLRRINPVVTRILVELGEKLTPFYSDIGRASIDPELMIRMLIVGYCYGIRFERKLCEEVKLHLGYRWFCRLELDDKIPGGNAFLKGLRLRSRMSLIKASRWRAARSTRSSGSSSSSRLKSRASSKSISVDRSAPAAAKKKLLHFRPSAVDFCGSRLAIGAATERARALAMPPGTRAQALQTRL